MNAVERATDDGEGAAGHTAAARFLARMRRIDERHARAARRERVCRPRAGGPRANDGNVRVHRATLHAMAGADAGRFTVAVFQDVAWATKGLDALKQSGFVRESLS